MMLPLRMDRMHATKQSETLNISCPQELHVDEEDWTVADPNLYPQTYRTKEQISILKLRIMVMYALTAVNRKRKHTFDI